LRPAGTLFEKQNYPDISGDCTVQVETTQKRFPGVGGFCLVSPGVYRNFTFRLVTVQDKKYFWSGSIALRDIGTKCNINSKEENKFICEIFFTCKEIMPQKNIFQSRSFTTSANFQRVTRTKRQ